MTYNFPWDRQSDRIDGHLSYIIENVQLKIDRSFTYFWEGWTKQNKIKNGLTDRYLTEEFEQKIDSLSIYCWEGSQTCRQNSRQIY